MFLVFVSFVIFVVRVFLLRVVVSSWPAVGTTKTTKITKGERARVFVSFVIFVTRFFLLRVVVSLWPGLGTTKTTKITKNERARLVASGRHHGCGGSRRRPPILRGWFFSSL